MRARGGIIGTLAACLLLGLLTTVAVSWTIALRWSPDIHLLEHLPSAWPAEPPPGWPPAASLASFTSTSGSLTLVGQYTRMVPTPTPLEPLLEQNENRRIFVRRYGWPFLAMQDEKVLLQVGGAGSETVTSVYRQGVAVWWREPRPSPLADRKIPLKPVLPGFAANIVMYSVIFGGLFAAARATRRAIRRRAGLCPGCGYDLRGTALCPECGRVIAGAIADR